MCVFGKMEDILSIVHHVEVAGQAHLAQTNESYWQHGLEALCCAWWLLVAACAALVHAAVPGVFTNTASSLAAHVVRSVAARHHRGTKPDAPTKAH